MTRQQMVEAVSQAGQWSRKDTETVLNAFLEQIAKSLQTGERIELRGFGSFQVKQKKARQARNPKTGAVVEIAARKAIVFKPGKELVERAGKPPASAEEE